MPDGYQGMILIYVNNGSFGDDTDVLRKRDIVVRGRGKLFLVVVCLFGICFHPGNLIRCQNHLDG